MAWSAYSACLTSTTVAATEILSNFVTLNPGEVAHVQCILVNISAASPTDDFIFSVYGCIDTASAVDNVPFAVAVVPKENEPGYRSIVVDGLKFFKVGVKRSGTTDTATVSIAFALDGVSL